MLSALSQRLQWGHRLAGDRTAHVPAARPRYEAGRDLAQASPIIYFSLHGRRSVPAKGHAHNRTNLPAPPTFLHRHAPTAVTPISVSALELHMSKRGLRATQMLKEAREWSDALTLMEMNSPREPLEDVWRRLETQTGVPFGTFWSLRWRFSQLKDIWASTHSLLRDAHALRLTMRERRSAILAEIDAIARGTSGG
jgi:hypothetical protein